MPKTIVWKTAFTYLVSKSVVLRARRAKLLSQVDHVVGVLSIIVKVVERCDATPSTKCGKGSGSLAQDEKLSIHPTIEVAGLIKRLLDCNSLVSADAPGLSSALAFHCLTENETGTSNISAVL